MPDEKFLATSGEIWISLVGDRSSESFSIQRLKIKEREKRSGTRRRTMRKRTKEWDIIRRESNGKRTTRRKSNCEIKVV